MLIDSLGIRVCREPASRPWRFSESAAPAPSLGLPGWLFTNSIISKLIKSFQELIQASTSEESLVLPIESSDGRLSQANYRCKPARSEADSISPCPRPQH